MAHKNAVALMELRQQTISQQLLVSKKRPASCGTGQAAALWKEQFKEHCKKHTLLKRGLGKQCVPLSPF